MKKNFVQRGYQWPMFHCCFHSLLSGFHHFRKHFSIVSDFSYCNQPFSAFSSSSSMVLEWSGCIAPNLIQAKWTLNGTCFRSLNITTASWWRYRCMSWSFHCSGTTTIPWFTPSNICPMENSLRLLQIFWIKTRFCLSLDQTKSVTQTIASWETIFGTNGIILMR